MNDHLEHASDQGQHPPFVPQTPEQQRTHDDILQVLSDFQHGLESLKALHEQRTQLQEALVAREAELAELARELRERDRSLADQHTQTDEARAGQQTLAAQLSQAQDDVRSLNAQVQEARALQQSLTQQAEEARAEHQALTAHLAEARATIESHEARAAELLSRVVNAERAAEETAATLAKADATIQALQDRLRAELGDAKAARADLDGAQTRIKELEADVARLTSSCAGLESTIAEMKEQFARSNRARPADATDRRRQRLARVRLALRERNTRLKKGGEALAKRFEQVEQVLKQRAELAQVRERVIAADRAIQRAAATSRASTTVFAVLASIALLGALSWAVARQIAPATYASECTLQADGRGRDLTDAELEEWLRFHNETLADPRFHEEAAARFARQGSTSLAAASALSKFVASNVSTDSVSPGQLTIRLRAQGKENARRTLETLAAALAAYANAAEARRIDGGATLIPAPARAEDSPLDNTQTYYALGLLGASMLACAILGAAIWKKLASGKSAFEQDAQLASVLDEARWASVTRR